MIPVNKLPHLAFLVLVVSLSSCVDDEPKASFIVDQDPENRPLYATFTSTSKHAESLRWYIEGNYVTAPLLEYRFTVAGTYNIELEITNEDGETDRVTQVVEIPDVSPCGDAWKAKELALFDQYFAEHNITPLFDEASGYQYSITEPGNGTKIVTGHEAVLFKTTYYLLDGTAALVDDADEYKHLNRFDSWTIAQLKAMEEGSTVRWFVPSCLAFGRNGYFDKIPPYTPVIEEIELIDIGPEPCQC